MALSPDCGVARKLTLVSIGGCRSLRWNPSDADMGTDTLFVYPQPVNVRAPHLRDPNGS